MKTRFALAAIAAAFLSTAAVAQMGQGMGPGMMGGHGPGQGMMQGQGGQGMGQGGCGMMGRHGQGGGGMGGGMMGGGRMGGGMMGGDGGMGLPGPAVLDRLGLTEEQRGKVRDIQRDLQRKRHGLMGSMHEVRWQAEDAARAPELDEAAARKSYDAMAAIRKQLFEAGLEGRKRFEAVLTREQREQYRQSPRPR